MKGTIWRSVRSKAEKLGSTLEKALADSEDMNVQKNRVVLREVVKKKNGYFTVRLTVRGGGGGGPPPPPA